MILAFDLDKTLDRVPHIWKQVVELFNYEADWMVILVSCRKNTKENKEIARGFLAEYGIRIDPNRIFFTDGQAKAAYLRYKFNMEVAVWIDDDPACIIHGK